MKTPTTARPRFTCRVVQGWTSIFGDHSSGSPRGFGSAHLAACADCQRFLEAGRMLDASLRRSAVARRPAAPAGLDQRIIEAVNLSVRPAPRRSSGLAVLAFAGTAAGLALAFFLFERQPARPGTPIVALPPSVPAEAVAAGPAGSNPVLNSVLLAQDSLQTQVNSAYSEARSVVRLALDSNSLLNAVPPSADALISANPLQTEVDSAYSDARSAVHFLALNFLPSSPEDSALGRENAAPASAGG